MDLKEIQKKLKDLRDRIRADGTISPEIQAELQTLLTDTLISANKELTAVQEKLSTALCSQPGNDNKPLSDEQKKRLRIVEKTGTGSQAVH